MNISNFASQRTKSYYREDVDCDKPCVMQVRRGIRAAECGSMMQQFFQRRRQENKTKDIRKEEFDKLQLADSDI